MSRSCLLFLYPLEQHARGFVFPLSEFRFGGHEFAPEGSGENGFGKSVDPGGGDATLAIAMGGEAVRDAYSCQLTCHDPSGEITSVTFSRDVLRITSTAEPSRICCSHRRRSR